MIHAQLEMIMKTKFEISNSKLNKSDSLEAIINNFSDSIKENLKGNKMIDESLVSTMKDVWEQVCERFKPLNLSKYQKQAQKDAQNWIANRFSQQKNSPKKNDNTELFALFDS